jgi:hypothetical protein
MSHPLDDARLKIAWAKENLDAVNAEIGPYIESRPYEFQTEQAGEVLTAKEAIINVQPPVSLRRHVSACLSNLRPILDYIAWQLGTRSPARPLTESDEKRIQFPIVADPAKFQDSVKHLKGVCGVPAAAINEIERVQPYNAGFEPIGTLSQLVNEDKHRLPVLTVAYADTTSIEVSVSGAPLKQLVMHPPGSKAILSSFNSTGMIVRRLTPEDLANPDRVDLISELMAQEAQRQTTATQPTAVKVDGKVTVFVALQKAPPLVPVERTLEQIINCLDGVITRFEAHF